MTLEISSVDHSRPDGSFVATVNGYPYHVTEGGPLWSAALAMVAQNGLPPPEPPPEPVAAAIPPISDRQFAQGLALRGLITKPEALLWVRTGDLPAAIESFVVSLPEADEFTARMVLSGATEFRRDGPLVETFGQLTGMTSAALDAFWRECAAL
jgi:hypothetical protein